MSLEECDLSAERAGMNHDHTAEVLTAARLSPPRLDRLTRARVATSAFFLVDGMTFGTWAALIPSFQQRFVLSAGQLSWVLVGIVAGAMASMPIAGRLTTSYGSHRVGFAAGVAFPGCLLALMLAPNAMCLVAAATLFGACKGLMDIAVNAQGIAVENALGRPVISSFNGFWSLGGLAAAATLSFALHRGAGAPLLLGVMSAALMATTLVSGRHLLPEQSAPTVPRNPSRTLPDGRLLALGALAFLALFSEGVLLDWSAVYAHTVARVSLATAPVAFAAFSVCMAAGRFAGDVFTARWGTAAALRLGAALMVVGTGVATLGQTWSATLVGFMVVGFGVANLVPIIFRAAGRVHAHGAGPGVAVVSTLGYTGFLCGPPTVGFLAAAAGLPGAFCLVIVFGLILAAVGGSVLSAASRGPSSAF